MALQGFDKNYFLPQALAVLQEQDPDTWRGQNAAYLEEQLAAYNFTPQDLYEMWGWKYDLAPNQYFDKDYYVLALSTWAVNNDYYPTVTAAKAAILEAWAGKDFYQHYIQYGSASNINPSAGFDESAYIDNLFAWAQANASATLTSLGITDAAGLRTFFTDNGLTALDNYMDYGRLVNIPATPVSGGELVGLNPGTTFTIATEQAGTANVMHITGDQDVRIDLTNPANQIKGLDLDGDGTIESDGFENNVSGLAANFAIVDAYSRNPLNHNDINNNFLGDIQFDGTGFQGDGVNTDGNIFLGGLGADTAFGGIGNDFMTGGGVANSAAGRGDTLSGGRNADFFFVELSALDSTDGNNLSIDGGTTADDNSAGTTQSAQDSDWLLFEGSDDDEPVTINLRDDTTDDIQTGEAYLTQSGNIVSRSGQTVGVLRDIENVDASGNLYGFLNNVDVEIGGRATDGRVADPVAGTANDGIGSSAQLLVNGSNVANIIVAGYDNDVVMGNDGNDLLMGGNLHKLINPNLLEIRNDGRDELCGGAGDDNIVLELDRGIVNGGDAAADTSANDTLWLLDNAAGNSAVAGNTVADLTTDGKVRLDLGFAQYKGYRGDTLGENTDHADEANDTSTSNWVAGTADQSNYVATHGATTVVGMENIITTGLGAVDYKAAGANTASDVAFTNQQNFLGLNADLELRGTDGANILYANTGEDKIEGRQGNDLLSGGNGNDDFIFQLQVNAGDGVDVIHRQKDADGDNLWDIDPATGKYAYTQDFGTDMTATAHSTDLDITILNNDTTLVVGIVSFWLDGVKHEVIAGDLLNQNTIGEVASYLNEQFAAQDSRLSVRLTSGAASDLQGVITITAKAVTGSSTAPEFVETPGTAFDPNSVDCFINTNDSGAYSSSEQHVGGVDIAQDRLIYKAYEDRLDNEGVDDDSILGSTISLGADNYAEDLVVRFKMGANGEMQTMLAEDQGYSVYLKNVTTEDIVAIDVNGVHYELQVGKDLDGKIIPGEDSVNATQAEIQNAFMARYTAFINSFMDDDTSAGMIAATVPVDTDGDGILDTFVLTQVDYNGEETVFMDTPVVTLTNHSGGQIPEYRVTDVSQHSLHLLDYDGTNGALNRDNVLFVGEEFTNRSYLETAKTEGGELRGTKAQVIDAGNANNLKDIIHNLATLDSLDNPATTDDNFSVHGDDFLIGGAGDDEIYGETGDDRIQGSIGQDVLDGGKDLYAVRRINETEYTVETLNTYEAAQRSLEANVLEVNLIDQTEDGANLASGLFDDTLIYAQRDFTGSDVRFTVTLADDMLMKNGGAGTVGVDLDGNDSFEHNATFTNFENIRTVSGTGLAIAGAGQGNDTLDVSALSSNSGLEGVAYDLTNDGNAGQVYMRMSAGTLLPWVDVELIKVDGVEYVKSGSGDDKLWIDETEAAKNNKFLAGEGDDIIIYRNDYDTDDIAEPTVTINVGADETDTVVMNKGRVGSTVATDTLENVETISLEANTAQGVREDDTINVSTISGATVDYSIRLNSDYDDDNLPDEDYNYDGLIDAADYLVSVGRVSTSGDDDVLSVNNLFEVEKVVAGSGNDRVILADADLMNNNARSDENQVPVTDPVELVLDSYLNYDMTDRRVEDAAPQRLSIAELKNIGDGVVDVANTHDRSDIPEVINFEQFSFEMGTGVDTVDYSHETGRIASIVEFNQDNLTQYVLVDGDSDGLFNDAESRVDKLVSVENIVASQGESILDLTNAGQDLKITFSNNYDRSGSYTADYDSKYGLEVHEIKVANATTGSAIINMNYQDYVFVDTNLTDIYAPAPNAVWNRIEGSDYNETVEMSGWEADEAHTLNLRGGENRVTYEGDSVAITIDVIAPVAATPDTTGMIVVDALHTAPRDLHDADQSDDGQVSGIDVITSYSAQNTIAAGQLTIKGARRDEDSISFKDGIATLSKLIVLGGVVDATSAITVTIDDGGALQNSLNLVGFEILQDASSDDVYSMSDLQVVLDQLTLLDNPANDRDTIKVSDDAASSDFNGGLGTEFISLGALETEFSGFDFDILDISNVTNSTTPLVKLTILGDAADTEVQEIIVGALDAISDESGQGINNFDVLSLTNASAGTGFNLNLDKGEFQNTTGTRIFDFDGSTLDASRVTGRDMILTVTDTNNIGATVIGSAGNDTISGGSGDDMLMGGAGRDTMDGGADIPEIHKFTISDPDGGAGESITINGVTITEGAVIESIVVAENDADAIGAAFVRAWEANPAQFANRADLASVTYDATSNVLSFTFSTSKENVADDILGAVGGTAASKVAMEVSPYNDNGGDVFYAGANADKVAGGNGNDAFVVIGKVDAADYAAGAAAGTFAANFKAAVAAIENGQTTSDIAPTVISTTETVYETISGGLGTDTLELWGDVDFTAGTTVEDVENFNVHSTVKLYSKQIEDAKLFTLFDADSQVIIVDSLTGVETTYTQANIADLNDMLNPPDTVAPTLAGASPVDDSVDVAVSANVVLTFSEDVNVADASGIKLYDLATSSVVTATASVNGNVITINPDADLANSNGYYVIIDNGAVTDLAGNAFAGIADATTINFTTVAPVIPPDVTETVSAGNTVPYDASLSNVTFDLASGTYTYNVSYFAAGDKLVFPTGINPTVNNTDFTDNAVDVQWALGGQVITVHLTNIANDASLNSVSDFNTVFGAGTVNVGSVTPPSANVDVTAANATAYDATAANVTFAIASGTYTYNITGFAAGDILDFPAGIDATVNNTDFADNAVDVQWALGGQVVTIHLTGLAAGQDATLNSVADFNTVFGAGTIV